MPVPTASGLKLDTTLRAAHTGQPQRRTVWAMLRGEPGHAEPIKTIVEIRNEDGALVWHPRAGVTLDGLEVDLDTLKGDRVWWCSWPRRFAQSRLRVEQEAAQSDAGKVLAGMDEAQRRVLHKAIFAAGYNTFRDRMNDGADGDSTIRVLAEFSPPRGYGDA